MVDHAEERSVQLYVPKSGRAYCCDGLKAELLALIASRTLSERSLKLLWLLVCNEAKLDRVRHGRLEVDFSSGHAHPYLRETWPRFDFDEVPTEPEDSDAA